MIFFKKERVFFHKLVEDIDKFYYNRKFYSYYNGEDIKISSFTIKASAIGKWRYMSSNQFNGKKEFFFWKPSIKRITKGRTITIEIQSPNGLNLLIEGFRQNGEYWIAEVYVTDTTRKWRWGEDLWSNGTLRRTFCDEGTKYWVSSFSII